MGVSVCDADGNCCWPKLKLVGTCCLGDLVVVVLVVGEVGMRIAVMRRVLSIDSLFGICIAIDLLLLVWFGSSGMLYVAKSVLELPGVLVLAPQLQEVFTISFHDCPKITQKESGLNL